MARRVRLDREVQRRGLAGSADEAVALIEQGHILVDGTIAQKPNRQVDPAQAIERRGPAPRFVSRAGQKLDDALHRFGIDPAGWRCLDVGSSTGGFTDALLQRGAAAVVAVDVGRHQLHERLRVDPRVVLWEQRDIRSVTLEDLDEPVDLCVGDVSFISLTKILPTAIALTKPGAELVLLIKPQFETSHETASKSRGIITDPLIWEQSISTVMDAARQAGAPMIDIVVSSVRGTSGNTEFVARFRRPARQTSAEPLTTVRGEDDHRGEESMTARIRAAIDQAQRRS